FHVTEFRRVLQLVIYTCNILRTVRHVAGHIIIGQSPVYIYFLRYYVITQKLVHEEFGLPKGITLHYPGTGFCHISDKAMITIGRLIRRVDKQEIVGKSMTGIQHIFCIEHTRSVSSVLIPYLVEILQLRSTATQLSIHTLSIIVIARKIRYSK